MLAMLHMEVRAARLECGLSQVELARLAGITRKSLRSLESGGNFEIDTLKKVLPHLPQLKTVHLGRLAIQTGFDPAAAQQVLLDLITAAGRALALFPGAEPSSASAGATRHDGGTAIDASLETRLRALEASVRGKEKQDS